MTMHETRSPYSSDTVIPVVNPTLETTVSSTRGVGPVETVRSIDVTNLVQDTAENATIDRQPRTEAEVLAEKKKYLSILKTAEKEFKVFSKANQWQAAFAVEQVIYETSAVLFKLDAELKSIKDAKQRVKAEQKSNKMQAHLDWWRQKNLLKQERLKQNAEGFGAISRLMQESKEAAIRRQAERIPVVESNPEEASNPVDQLLANIQVESATRGEVTIAALTSEPVETAENARVPESENLPFTPAQEAVAAVALSEMNETQPRHISIAELRRNETAAAEARAAEQQERRRQEVEFIDQQARRVFRLLPVGVRDGAEIIRFVMRDETLRAVDVVQQLRIVDRILELSPSEQTPVQVTAAVNRVVERVAQNFTGNRADFETLIDAELPNTVRFFAEEVRLAEGGTLPGFVFTEAQQKYIRREALKQLERMQHFPVRPSEQATAQISTPEPTTGSAESANVVKKQKNLLQRWFGW